MTRPTEATSTSLWPTAEPKADEMIRYFVAEGLRARDRLMQPSAPGLTDLDRALIARLQRAHDVVMLLRTLRELDAGEADAAARCIWSAAVAGDSYGELLWEWAVDAGLDPADYTTGGDR